MGLGQAHQSNMTARRLELSLHTLGLALLPPPEEAPLARPPLFRPVPSSPSASPSTKSSSVISDDLMRCRPLRRPPPIPSSPSPPPSPSGSGVPAIEPGWLRLRVAFAVAACARASEGRLGERVEIGVITVAMQTKDGAHAAAGRCPCVISSVKGLLLMRLARKNMRRPRAW